MIKRLPLVMAALILGLAAQAYGQTTGLEMQLSASPDRNGPPVEMNMAWARENTFVLPPGKTLRMFVLWGDFGREGQWLSKFLPRGVRAGKGPALMFEEGRWQPLKPVGVRHGLEVPFGNAMARRMAGEFIGVVACSGAQVGALVAEAKAGITAEVLAVIQLREHTADSVVFDASWSDRFNSPNLLLLDMTSMIPVSPSNLNRSDAISDKTTTMVHEVLSRMNSIGKE